MEDTTQLFRRLHGEDSDENSESDEQRNWQFAERWKSDDDHSPAVGPDGPDEQDRVLLDEPRFMRPTHAALPVTNAAHDDGLTVIPTPADGGGFM
jgi:enhancer of polycomb-like protein